MQLVFCVLSESVDTSQIAEAGQAGVGGTRVSISGVFGVVRPLFIPGQYSFTVSVGVRGVDRAASHTFRMVIRDPRGSQVSDLHGVAPAPASSSEDRPIPLDDTFGILSFQAINVPFSTDGRYEMDVWVDDELLLRSNPLPVYAAQTA